MRNTIIASNSKRGGGLDNAGGLFHASGLSRSVFTFADVIITYCASLCRHAAKIIPKVRKVWFHDTLRVRFTAAHTPPCRKFGFTLAEVLITLGIIGVLAAMTMPALIQKHNTLTIETRLEKFYSVINQAIIRSEVDNGDKKYWISKDTDEFFNKYLKPYLKYTAYKNKRVGTSNDWRLINLPDGSAFLIDIYGTWDDEGNQTYKTNGGHFIFCPFGKDCINGNSKLKWGRTQFVFGYWPAGEIAPKYHKDKGVEPYLNGWDGKEDSLYTTSYYGCNKDARNFYCTAIIQRNGWKIPKNYPYKF